MKRKLPTCSTGHNTGMSYVRGLHESLIQERRRKLIKKNRRVMNKLHGYAFQEDRAMRSRT